MNHSQSLYISVYFYAIRIAKAEEMAQQLRGPRFGPNTYMVAYSHP